jgi:hypothetical protein
MQSAGCSDVSPNSVCHHRNARLSRQTLGPSSSVGGGPSHEEPSGRSYRPRWLDAEEAQALQAEGLDPDDPAVIAAIDIVRWELSLGT